MREAKMNIEITRSVDPRVISEQKQVSMKVVNRTLYVDLDDRER